MKEEGKKKVRGEAEKGMKKNTASRGKKTARKSSTRKASFLKSITAPKRKGRRKKTVVSTKVIAIITAVLVCSLFVTILCTQVFHEQLGRLFSKKYSVTDIDGSTKKYTADELEEELKSDRFYQGIHVDGVDLSGKTLEEAKSMFSELRSEHIDERVDIRFQIGNETDTETGKLRQKRLCIVQFFPALPDGFCCSAAP